MDGRCFRMLDQVGGIGTLEALNLRTVSWKSEAKKRQSTT